jgi:hypothetical protein
VRAREWYLSMVGLSTSPKTFDGGGAATSVGCAEVLPAEGGVSGPQPAEEERGGVRHGVCDIFSLRQRRPVLSRGRSSPPLSSAVNSPSSITPASAA